MQGADALSCLSCLPFTAPAPPRTSLPAHKQSDLTNDERRYGFQCEAGMEVLSYNE